MTTTVSSHSGRRWLQSLNPATTAFEGTVPTAPAKRIEIADLSTLDAEPMHNAAQFIPTPTEDAAAPEATFATREIYNQVHGTSETPAVEHMNSIVLPNMNTSPSTSGEHQIVFVNIPNVSPTPAAEADNEMKVLDVPKTATAEPVVDSANTPTTAPTNEITALVDSIFERFPLAASTVLLFVGTEENPHVDEACARVAAAIASRNIGDVLLIDADVAGQRLTKASNLTGQPGFLECINRSHPWRDRVISQNESSFAFMPAGECEMDRWNAKQLLINNVAEMKQDFQFVCVSAGSAHSNHAKLWFDVCEGSYLVVSLKSSNETFAKSSVNELKAGGARLLGCVVTDVQ